MKHWIFPFGMIQPHVPSPIYADFLKTRISYTVKYRRDVSWTGQVRWQMRKKSKWVNNSRFRPANQLYHKDGCVAWWWEKDGKDCDDRVVTNFYHGIHRIGKGKLPSEVSPDGIKFHINGVEIPFEEVRDLLGWPSHLTAKSHDVYRFLTPEEQMLFTLRFG